MILDSAIYFAQPLSSLITNNDHTSHDIHTGKPVCSDNAFTLTLERQKVLDITTARDAALASLTEACALLRQKNVIIDRLQAEINPFSSAALNSTNPEAEQLKRDVYALEETIKSLREEIRSLKENISPPQSEDSIARMQPWTGLFPVQRPTPPSFSRQSSVNSVCSVDSRVILPSDERYKTLSSTQDAEERLAARHELLASIPLPSDTPGDVLSPLNVPSSVTLRDFLNSTNGSLRSSLMDYRILQKATTTWCPQREEHGYFIAPLFKCVTNPKAACAHQWCLVDIMARIQKPFDCFYDRENGSTYYAGLYEAFRLDDLTVSEWAALSQEARTAIIKQTLSTRKHVTPQTTYETTQLYAIGALKVACVGIKCVGFDRETYEGLQKHASRKGGATDSDVGKMMVDEQDIGSRSTSSMGSNDLGAGSAIAVPAWDGGLSSNGSIWNSTGGLGNGELSNLMGKLRIHRKSSANSADGSQ